MKTPLLVLAALLAPPLVIADGLPLRDGRYPGLVVDLKLTEQQKKAIDQYRSCQLEHSDTMNVYTPYVFVLTPLQASEVKKKAGHAPQRFQVYETVRGFNDAGPHWNLALRYSVDRMEIPIELLLPEAKATAAHRAQSWKLENPCFPHLRHE
jgi:hypothetical protein